MHRSTVVVLALGVLLGACSSGAQQDDDALAPQTQACAAAQRQTVQGGSHLIGAAAPPVPWSSDPPTSGWHATGAGFPAGAYAEPVPESEQVAVLERGGVVVAFDPGLEPSTAGTLLELAGQVDGDVVITPHVRGLPTPVTLTAWGVLQRCEVVDSADVAAFAEVHAGLVGGH